LTSSFWLYLEKSTSYEAPHCIVFSNLLSLHLAIQSNSRVIAQAVSRWLPTAAVRGSRPGLSCGILWWTKWRWGRFSPSTSVPLPNFLPPIAPKIILNYHLGFVQ
jgi:hypothetical protein